MLRIILPEFELYDESKEEFVIQPEEVLEFEHSLVSLSKWEQKYERPFISKTPFTTEETLDYMSMMCSRDLSPELFLRLSNEDATTIENYMNAKMTATWFKEDGKKRTQEEVITNEVIYYWMISASVPMECQHWHLNRLFTLLRVISEKNAPEKKKTRREIMAEHRRVNEERRAKYNTNG